jgi:hypothetical protein
VDWTAEEVEACGTLGRACDRALAESKNGSSVEWVTTDMATGRRWLITAKPIEPEKGTSTRKRVLKLCVLKGGKRS